MTTKAVEADLADHKARIEKKAARLAWLQDSPALRIASDAAAEMLDDPTESWSTFSLTFAALAQAEAAERQALAAERQAEAAERQADALESLADTLTGIVGKVGGQAVVKTWDDMSAAQVGRVVDALNAIAKQWAQATI